MRTVLVARVPWFVSRRCALLSAFLLFTIHGSLLTARLALAAPLSDVDSYIRLNPMPVLPWGRDPFSEHETGPRTQPGAPDVVSAIFYNARDPSRSMAVVEGQVVRAGDLIRGRRVLEIAREKVVVADEERVVDLPLTSVKTSAEEKSGFTLKRQEAGKKK